MRLMCELKYINRKMRRQHSAIIIHKLFYHTKNFFKGKKKNNIKILLSKNISFKSMYPLVALNNNNNNNNNKFPYFSNFSYLS